MHPQKDYHILYYVSDTSNAVQQAKFSNFSPFLVLNTSSKMLGTSPLCEACSRTVYTVPGLSPSTRWKPLDVFKASESCQIPSPEGITA